MAIPSLQMMAQNGILAGIGIPETNNEMEQDCRHIFGRSPIPIRILKRKTLTEDAQTWLQEIQSGYVWLMTFPWRIPVTLLENFPGKFYNFHYGLLPQMRGVDPVFESIRRKNTETGITVHQVTPEIDKGPVLAVQKIPLRTSTTHGLLCTQMANAAPQLCQQLMALFQQYPDPPAETQSEQEAVYYGRPGLKDVVINWNALDSSSVDALIRACNPWNKGAYTRYGNWSFRILSATDAGESTGNHQPGVIVKGENNECFVHCKDNRLLKIAIIYTDEGFFEGSKLFEFGLSSGNSLS